MAIHTIIINEKAYTFLVLRTSFIVNEKKSINYEMNSENT